MKESNWFQLIWASCVILSLSTVQQAKGGGEVGVEGQQIGEPTALKWQGFKLQGVPPRCHLPFLHPGPFPFH